jgi:DNA-binding Xre family transcriptional regulator
MSSTRRRSRYHGWKTVVIRLAPDEYKVLSDRADIHDRDPFQHARWLVRRALGFTLPEDPLVLDEHTSDQPVLGGATVPKLAAVLEERQISQWELSRRSGVTRVTVNKACNGRAVALETRVKLARALEVDPDELSE